MAPKRSRVYSQEEVNAILSRAVERQSPMDGLTHEELIDTARQAGISVESVEEAARELAAGGAGSASGVGGAGAGASPSGAPHDVKRAVAEELAIQRLHARRGLFGHVVTYAAVNALLVTINVLTGSFPWALFPALGWGIGLALHLVAFLSPNPRRAEHARARLERRWEKQRQKRARERRREDAGHAVGESAKEFGQAVERGVATMLAAAAKRIHEEVDRAEESPASPSPRAQPKARVATRARVEDDAVEEVAESEDGGDAARKAAGRR